MNPLQGSKIESPNISSGFSSLISSSKQVNVSIESYQNSITTGIRPWIVYFDFNFFPLLRLWVEYPKLVRVSNIIGFLLVGYNTTKDSNFASREDSRGMERSGSRSLQRGPVFPVFGFDVECPNIRMKRISSIGFNSSLRSAEYKEERLTFNYNDFGRLTSSVDIQKQKYREWGIRIEKMRLKKSISVVSFICI